IERSDAFIYMKRHLLSTINYYVSCYGNILSTSLRIPVKERGLDVCRLINQRAFLNESLSSITSISDLFVPTLKSSTKRVIAPRFLEACLFFRNATQISADYWRGASIHQYGPFGRCHPHIQRSCTTLAEERSSSGGASDLKASKDAVNPEPRPCGERNDPTWRKAIQELPSWAKFWVVLGISSVAYLSIQTLITAWEAYLKLASPSSNNKSSASHVDNKQQASQEATGSSGSSLGDMFSYMATFLISTFRKWASRTEQILTRAILEFNLIAKMALIISASLPLILVFGTAYSFLAKAPLKVRHNPRQVLSQSTGGTRHTAEPQECEELLISTSW
ncbi:hypothetical protein CEUSTIGMA_g14080.t1, partial [Chlamydomonas eustigma]